MWSYKCLLDIYSFMEKHQKTILHISRVLFIAAFVLALAGQGHAQKLEEQEVEEMSTSRPDLTQGTYITPQKMVQIEAGLSYWKDTPKEQEVKARAYPEVLVRLGLLKWLELRLQGSVQDSVIRENTLRRRVSGVGPWSAGLRVRLLEEKGLLPAVALQSTVRLPFGDDEVTPAHAEPEFTLAVSKEFSQQISMTYNLGYGWEEGEPLKSYGVNLEASLSDVVTVYIEAVGEKQRGSRAEHLADMGLLFLLMPNLQLDFAAGRQLSSAAPDYFLTTGISVRLPR